MNNTGMISRIETSALPQWGTNSPGYLAMNAGLGSEPEKHRGASQFGMVWRRYWWAAVLVWLAVAIPATIYVVKNVPPQFRAVGSVQRCAGGGKSSKRSERYKPVLHGVSADAGGVDEESVRASTRGGGCAVAGVSVVSAVDGSGGVSYLTMWMWRRAARRRTSPWRCSIRMRRRRRRSWTP